MGLSEHAPEGGTPTAELTEQIKSLRASVTVEAAPERVVRKAVRAERPVTARIRERLAPQEARIEPQMEEAKLEPVQVSEPVAEVIARPVAKPVEVNPEVVIPAMYQDRGHVGRVAKRRDDGGQLRLF